MRGDAEHGDARAVTVEQTVDEVQIARSAAPRADRELTRQMRLGAGRKRGDLLVPDLNPRDLPLPSDGICQTVEAVADDAVDPFDTRRGKGFRELVGHGLHGPAPRCMRSMLTLPAEPPQDAIEAVRAIGSTTRSGPHAARGQRFCDMMETVLPDGILFLRNCRPCGDRETVASPARITIRPITNRTGRS